MAITIDANETIRLTASFLDYDEDTDVETPLDLDSVTGTIYLYNTSTSVYDEYTTFTPELLSDGVYYVDWTPVVDGKYKVEFVGSLNGGNDEVVNTRIFYVGEITSINSLVASAEYYFLGVLDPIYADPELVLKFYPEGDLVEITELIHWYSEEILTMKNVTTLTTITPIMRDFIIASVLCDLSRQYIFDGGMSGFTAANKFTLGDLQVDKSTGSSGSKSKNQYDRGSATTWCELASLLRNQLNATGANMKAVVPSKNDMLCALPNRSLKRID